MILLGFISFLVGSLIVVGAPFLLLPEAPQRPSDVATVLAGCAMVGLTASGFFLVGVAGNHMKRSRRTRALGALLLGVPILGSCAILFMDNTAPETWMIGPVLCCATFLFISFVFPARPGRSYRSLRPREPSPAPPSTVKA
jgi:peptidoglycan/LPS O-acetylase OafA/YrhL